MNHIRTSLVKPNPGITPKGSHPGTMMQSVKYPGEVLPDGGLVVTADQLKRFGNGDASSGRRELRLLLSLDPEVAYSGAVEKCPERVRIATAFDEPGALALWLHDLKENAEHIAPIDESKVLNNIQAGTRNRGGVVALIDGPDKKPVAIMVLHLMEWHWSRGWYWQEMVNYVHPDHRKHKYAEDLMAFAKWWTDQHSKSAGHTLYMLCGVLGGWRIRAKIGLYRRKFKQVGACFLWPAPPNKGN